MSTADVHPGVAATGRLRRIADALAAGSQPPDDDAQWLAGRLTAYLAADADVDLDGLLGLLPPPGGTSWRSAARYAERDRLLREVAATLPGRTNTRAVELQRRLRHYGGTSWPRDRRSGTPTTANAKLYAVFTLDPNPPTSVRRLTEIISE